MRKRLRDMTREEFRAYKRNWQRNYRAGLPTRVRGTKRPLILGIRVQADLLERMHK